MLLRLHIRDLAWPALAPSCAFSASEVACAFTLSMNPTALPPMTSWPLTAGIVPGTTLLVSPGATRRPPNRPRCADTCGCTCSGSSGTCVGTASYNGYPNACSTNASGVNVGVNNGAAVRSARQSPPATTTSCTSRRRRRLSRALHRRREHHLRADPHLQRGGHVRGARAPGDGLPGGRLCAPDGRDVRGMRCARGDVACPTFGFTQQVLASTGSPGYVDGRTCGACPCATASRAAP